MFAGGTNILSSKREVCYARPSGDEFMSQKKKRASINIYRRKYVKEIKEDSVLENYRLKVRLFPVGLTKFWETH